MTENLDSDEILSKLIANRPEDGAETELEIAPRECFGTIFRDHAVNKWDDLAENTYHASEQENRLLRAFEESLWTERNLLVVGNSGHGKTTVLKKVLYELNKKLTGKADLHCEYLNLRPLGPKVAPDAITSIYNEVLLKIAEHYGSNPAPDLRDQVESSITTGKLNRLIQSISLDELTSRQKAVIFVIDDVDYIEHDLHRPILEKLRPLLNSPNVTVVWACRPPALMELEYEFTNQSKNPFITVSPTQVCSPPVQDLIISRIWPFLDLAQSEPKIVEKIELIKNRQGIINLERSLIDYLKKVFSRNKFKIKKMPYPFGPRQEDFIRLASNGDIRVIFGMLGKLISDIHAGNLNITVRTNEEGLIQAPRVERKPFLASLGAGHSATNPQLPHQERDLWRVLNLFETMSRNGRAPLLVCVLEWIVIGDRMFGDAYYKEMINIGFSKDQADAGADYCRSAKLIEPEAIKTGSFNLIASNKGRGNWKWILTEKGSFYLRDLITWPEYPYKRSSYQSLFEKIPDNQVNHDIVELLGHMVLADRTIQRYVEEHYNFKGSAGYFRVDKRLFFKLFRDIYGSAYLQSIRIGSSGDVVKHDLLTDEMVSRVCQSIKISRKNSMHLMRTAGTYFEVKRRAVEDSLDQREIRVPNHDQLVVEDYLDVVYDCAWRSRIERKDLEPHAHKTIYQNTLRILQVA